MDDFDLMMPGILILSVIMLMFTATIALITEVENKTLIRLRMSKMSTFEFLTGMSVSQVMIGIISILLTLITAIGLGFDYYGSLWVIILIAALTSISIICFSLILAAFTRSVNEVLIVGNFPLFLFMFFTGAAFPIKAKALITIAGYPVSFQSLMSPTHAISALNKILIMNLKLIDIIPEIIALLLISILYFIVGAWAFRIKHMRIN
jgi:ABC-2 type transport system permease protein